MTHVDVSEQLRKQGRAVTHLYAGARKVDGSPYSPLSAAARERFQAEVDWIYDEFVQAVAAYRGMTADAVRATEAATYRGAAGVAAGLADRVITLDDYLSHLSSQRAGQVYSIGPLARSTLGATTMRDENTAGASLQPAQPIITQADLDAAESLGREAGADAERARLLGILEHPEAAGREPSALALAKTPAMTPEAAAAVLATLPKQTVGADNQFAAEMARIQGQQSVGVLAETDDADGAAIQASWSRAAARLAH
jgi:hypothetical protein